MQTVTILAPRKALRAWRALTDAQLSILAFYEGRRQREYIPVPEVSEALGLSVTAIQNALRLFDKLGLCRMPRRKYAKRKIYAFSTVTVETMGQYVMRLEREANK